MTVNLPFIELHFGHGDAVRDKGLHRLRVGLEQLEKGDDADRLEVFVENGPTLLQVGLMLVGQLPFGLKLSAKKNTKENRRSNWKMLGERANGGALQNF